MKRILLFIAEVSLLALWPGLAAAGGSYDGPYVMQKASLANISAVQLNGTAACTSRICNPGGYKYMLVWTDVVDTSTTGTDSLDLAIKSLTQYSLTDTIYRHGYARDSTGTSLTAGNAQVGRILNLAWTDGDTLRHFCKFSVADLYEVRLITVGNSANNKQPRIWQRYMWMRDP